MPARTSAPQTDYECRYVSESKISKQFSFVKTLPCYDFRFRIAHHRTVLPIGDSRDQEHDETPMRSRNSNKSAWTADGMSTVLSHGAVRGALFFRESQLEEAERFNARAPRNY